MPARQRVAVVPGTLADKMLEQPNDGFSVSPWIGIGALFGYFIRKAGPQVGYPDVTIVQLTKRSLKARDLRGRFLKLITPARCEQFNRIPQSLSQDTQIVELFSFQRAIHRFTRLAKLLQAIADYLRSGLAKYQDLTSAFSCRPAVWNPGCRAQSGSKIVTKLGDRSRADYVFKVSTRLPLLPAMLRGNGFYSRADVFTGFRPEFFERRKNHIFIAHRAETFRDRFQTASRDAALPQVGFKVAERTAQTA